MKRQKKSQMITLAALGLFGLGLVFSVFGMSQTIVKIDEEAIARTPEAVLASAGVENGADVNLAVTYFDQKQDACVNLYDVGASRTIKERQFEWTSCGYEYGQIEEGLVEYELGKNLLPVAKGGKLIPNRGLTNMSRWFENVEGKSKEYTGNLKLAYKVNEAAEFSFASNDFYPLDGTEFSAEDEVNKDGHNHLWTMNFAVPFTVMASGAESFEITADDDTFVFVGKELALDMGGIHAATTGKIAVNENGEVYTGVESADLAYSGIKVAKGQEEVIRIFHAERDAKDAVFKVKLTEMNLNVVQTQLASGMNDVQVAVVHDPSSSDGADYMGPLGESSVVRSDGTKGYLIMATVLAVAIVTCAMFTVITAHALIKNKDK
ncbi:hypothetical protein IKF89_01660 [Candidatus Saccharibacteria bacterium]|nr:hypothetical protein [Candidatus Saccharibacteria bacterium]